MQLQFCFFTFLSCGDALEMFPLENRDIWSILVTVSLYQDGNLFLFRMEWMTLKTKKGAKS